MRRSSRLPSSGSPSKEGFRCEQARRCRRHGRPSNLILVRRDVGLPCQVEIVDTRLFDAGMGRKKAKDVSDHAMTDANQTDKGWDRVDDARMEQSRLHGTRRTNGSQRSAGEDDARERGWKKVTDQQHREEYRTREQPPYRRQLARELTNLYRGRCRSRNCTAWTKICSRSSGKSIHLYIGASMSRALKRNEEKRGGRLTALGLSIATDRFMASSFSSNGPMKSWMQKWTKKWETRSFSRAK